MSYIVLIPAWISTVLIVAAWGTLAYQALFRLSLRQFAMNGLLLVLALKSIFAVSTAIVTSRDPIDSFACLTGIFGFYSFPIIILIELIVLAFTYRIWLERRGDKKHGFLVWLLVWISLSIVVLFAFLRFCVFAFLRFCVFAFLRFCVFAFLRFCVFAFLRFCVQLVCVQFESKRKILKSHAEPA
ncbi:hypothetical protein ACJJH9_12100 [Microbulbifer sp. DLAB2-AF]|uniref:hypothetical protein n=1 Tax=Microbulbifer sp. DLAB2-AF TaxID=3243395 RepID=UPI0040391EF6